MTRTRTIIARTAIAAGSLALVVIGTAGSASAAPQGPGAGKGAAITQLVTAGTITQAQADAIKAAATAAHDAKEAAHAKAKAAVLSGLVTAGTITQAQADAIAAAPRGQGVRQLVASGAITAAAAQQVHDAMKAAKAADATPRTSVLPSLVANGTITQAQADAITAAKPAKGPRG